MSEMESKLALFAYRLLLRSAQQYSLVLRTQPVSLAHFLSAFYFGTHRSPFELDVIRAHFLAKTGSAIKCRGVSEDVGNLVEFRALLFSGKDGGAVKDPKKMNQTLNARLRPDFLLGCIRTEFRRQLSDVQNIQNCTNFSLSVARFFGKEFAYKTRFLPAFTSISTIASLSLPSKTSISGQMKGPIKSSSSISLPAHVVEVLARNPNVQLATVADPSIITSVAAAPFIRLHFQISAKAENALLEESIVNAVGEIENMSGWQEMSSSDLKRAVRATADSSLKSYRQVFWLDMSVRHLGFHSTDATSLSASPLIEATHTLSSSTVDTCSSTVVKNDESAVQVVAHSMHVSDADGVSIDIWQQPYALPIRSTRDKGTNSTDHEVDDDGDDVDCGDEENFDDQKPEDGDRRSAETKKLDLKSGSEAKPKKSASNFDKYRPILRAAEGSNQWSGNVVMSLPTPLQKISMSLTVKHLRSGDEFIIELPPFVMSSYTSKPVPDPKIEHVAATPL